MGVLSEVDMVNGVLDETEKEKLIAGTVVVVRGQRHTRGEGGGRSGRRSRP